MAAGPAGLTPQRFLSLKADRLAGRELWLLGLLTLIWGMNWPIMKAGVNDIPPMTFRSLTMIVGLPVLWLMIRSQGNTLRVAREHWGELFRIAMTNMVIWYICVMYGVAMLSSGRAAILGYTMPIWAALIGIVLFGERPGPRLGLGVLAAACGVGLLMAGEVAALSGSPVGALFMLGAALSWGLGTHLMRRRKQPASVAVITFWSVALALIVCGSLALVTERGQWDGQASWAAWFSLGYNGVIVFGVAQLIWFRLATLLPPVASGLSVMLIPVIGLFSGSLLLVEPLHWHDWAALACVLSAIATVLLPARKPQD